MITNLFALALYAITTSRTLAADFVLDATRVRAEQSFSLNNRYADKWVNDVFKDNILLTLSYMNGGVPSRNVAWSDIEKPQSYSFTLNPGEVFAFHEDVSPEYKGKVTKTMNAHFNYDDGFKSSGYLFGDGVCHLASLLYRAAKDAGLGAVAPTNHDFAAIPEVPREYGVSIYFGPNAHGRSVRQNLYIANTFDKPVHFVFVFDGTNLTVRVVS